MAHIGTAHFGSTSSQPSEGRPGLFKQVISGIAHFLTSLDRALAATHDYENLTQLSDNQLVARGMNRSDLSKIVFERHYMSLRDGRA